MVDTENPLAPVRIVLQDDDFWGGTRSMVFCPVCRGENVHVGAVREAPYDHGSRTVISFWGGVWSSVRLHPPDPQRQHLRPHRERDRRETGPACVGMITRSTRLIRVFAGDVFWGRAQCAERLYGQYQRCYTDRERRRKGEGYLGAPVCFHYETERTPR